MQVPISPSDFFYLFIIALPVGAINVFLVDTIYLYLVMVNVQFRQRQKVSLCESIYISYIH